MHQPWEETVLDQYCGKLLHVVLLSRLSSLVVLEESWNILLQEEISVLEL